MTDFESASLRNIAIIGSGIAGSAAALFLRRAGHRVSQFEQSTRDASQGAGILLQPAALTVMRLAGLEQELWARGERIDRIETRFAENQQSFRLDYAMFSAEAHACGVHRAALLEILRKPDQGLESINWSVRINAVDPVNGFLHTSDGARVGPFDLIVAADGAHSAIRGQQPALVEHDRIYKEAALVCVVDCDPVEAGHGVLQRFHEETHVSTWPIGVLQPGGRKRMTIALSVRAEDSSRLASQPDEWLRRIRRIHVPLAAYIAALPAEPVLLPYTYRDVSTRSSVINRLVLIGDAAHAMSPQLGLGASLGLLDAWFLAKFLGERIPVANALDRFDRVRRHDVLPYQRMSRFATPYFQSDNRIMAALRAKTAVVFGRQHIVKQSALSVLCSIPDGLV